ncbi:hypothetical protein FKM82_007276 [Ascaphus truei]
MTFSAINLHVPWWDLAAAWVKSTSLRSQWWVSRTHQYTAWNKWHRLFLFLNAAVKLTHLLYSIQHRGFRKSLLFHPHKQHTNIDPLPKQTLL